MMEEEQIKKIMATVGRTHSGAPYQYKMNNKKRAIAARESLENDEEEVEYIWVVENIEGILHTTYERNAIGPRAGTEGRTHIHIGVSVEPINPCATKMPKRTPPFRQPNFSGRKEVGSTSTQGATTGAASLGRISKGSTSRGGSSSSLGMVRHNPTISLP